jgi:hypothetical protein
VTEQLRWFVGNRNPSISEQLTSDGVPVDLSTMAEVLFIGRTVGGTAITVSGTAALVNGGTLGDVRYDWTAQDVATGVLAAPPKHVLVWWRTIDQDGRSEDMNEAIIEVAEHAPVGLEPAYVEVEVLKSTLQLTGTTFAELEIKRALESASRAIDEVCGQRFWLDPGDTVRYYQAEPGADCIEIDPLVSLTSVRTAPAGGTAYTQAWVENRDFLLQPLNAILDGKPYDTIERYYPSARYWWPCYPRSVEVTGTFGWPSVPAGVQDACSIIATQIVRRTREAPFGVVTVGLDGEAIRIARSDPTVALCLDPYTRAKAYVG